jgi:hypothetical protein
LPQAGFELQSWSLPPVYLGLQAWATGTQLLNSLKVNFYLRANIFPKEVSV